MNNCSIDEEVWKDVVGYEGLYKVSSHGRVWSCSRNRIMSLKINKGYNVLSLRKNGVYRTESVHRLVAMAFVPNHENKPQVNHIDENKLNNKPENLEWVTSIENANHGTRIRRIQKHPLASEPKPVKQINVRTGEIIAIYDSITQAANAVSGEVDAISRCCNGIYKTSRGFRWEFA